MYAAANQKDGQAVVAVTNSRVVGRKSQQYQENPGQRGFRVSGTRPPAPRIAVRNGKGEHIMSAWIRSASLVAIAWLAAPLLLLSTAYCEDSQPRNLVVNGNFSADGGSLDGWTFNENVDNFYWEPFLFETTDYAINGCVGAVCITGTEEQQNYLRQTIRTVPGLKYELSFTYNASGGANELQALVGDKIVEDIVNAGPGSTTYTVNFVASRFETDLNFLGRSDSGFSFLTGISVICERGR